MCQPTPLLPPILVLRTTFASRCHAPSAIITPRNSVFSSQRLTVSEQPKATSSHQLISGYAPVSAALSNFLICHCTMASQAKPDIHLLSLAMQPFLDSSYSALIDQLSLKSSLKRAKSAQGALNYLSTNTPRAIIATDEGLTKSTSALVLEKVLAYVRSGGILIIGLHFPNFVDMDVFNSLFQHLGLPWERGDTTALNSATTLLPPYREKQRVRRCRRSIV